MEEQGIDEEPEDDTSPGSGFDLRVWNRSSPIQPRRFPEEQGTWRQLGTYARRLPGADGRWVW